MSREPIDAGPAVPSRAKPFCYSYREHRNGAHTYRIMCQTTIDGRECHFTAERIDPRLVQNRHLYGYAQDLAERWTKQLQETPELAVSIIMENRL